MGHQACEALVQWNYPLWLRDIVPQDPDGRDRLDHVDLPSLDGNSSKIYPFYRLSNYYITFIDIEEIVTSLVDYEMLQCIGTGSEVLLGTINLGDP